MSEFNKKLYMVKGIFEQDETEPIVTGFYYMDEHGRHFIIGDDFGHYETNPYTLCRCTGIKLKDSDYSITTLPSLTSVWKSVCPGCSIIKSQRGSSKLC